MDFSQNEICRLFGIQFPVVQGGMVWASGWRLASAVSNAGGLGLLGSGSMKPELLEEHIDKTVVATSRPFGVNIPLAGTYGAAHVDVCLQKKVKIVFTAAGSPKIHTPRLKEAGVTVVHVVPNALLAKKAEACGCDAVVAEGTEAGGHNGREGLTSLVMWPSVADAVSIPMIAAGGIGDGRAMRAAFILGAKGVQLGTRFAATVESTAHLKYKEACVQADGGQARIYNLQHMPIRSLMNDYVKEFCSLEAAGTPVEELQRLRGKGRSQKGVFEGDVNQGELVAGQICERIKDIPTVQELMTRLLDGFERAAVSISAR
ncbi:MAG: nitronate monooxygenase [Deltaproteobacteria bacterium]|nr:nitronate monooxygenase [Deltaproteobacteria bacterium]MBN2670124.1 nitronate monooxygenase [Deltaproteobacteria bacterium]